MVIYVINNKKSSVPIMTWTPNRRKSIIWINNDQVHQPIYASHGLDEFHSHLQYHFSITPSSFVQPLNKLSQATTITHSNNWAVADLVMEISFSEVWVQEFSQIVQCQIMLWPFCNLNASIHMFLIHGIDWGYRKCKLYWPCGETKLAGNSITMFLIAFRRRHHEYPLCLTLLVMRSICFRRIRSMPWLTSPCREMTENANIFVCSANQIQCVRCWYNYFNDVV